MGRLNSLPPPEPAQDWVYLPVFSTTLQPLQTPFDQAGPSPQAATFIYLTARSQRLSYLMSDMPPMDEVYAIETGRTQLWILEKLYCVHPKPGGKKRHPDKLARKENVSSLERNQWDGKVYVVLREPLSNVRSSDDVCLTVEPQEALAYAEEYAGLTGFRTVVALLHNDMFWH